MMTAILLLFLFALIVLAGALVFLIFKSKINPSDSAANAILVELQKNVAGLQHEFKHQVHELTDKLHSQLQRHTESLHQSQQGVQQTVHQVQDRLGQLQQATRQMMDIGRDISSLQDILRAPKLRGGLGELLLTELLRQILPSDHYSTQYRFQNGTAVDAVIFLGHGMIPVDAKFPLENFRRLLEAGDEESQKITRKAFAKDVKERIDEIAQKYILPEEGTFDFALMYIPAENVYYETIIKQDAEAESISQYALERHVIPVSPNSFYAYLGAIVRGLKGLKIERSAKVILESLEQLKVDFEKCSADFEKTGTHLSNAASSYEKAMKRFEKLQDKLVNLEELKRVTGPDTAGEAGNLSKIDHG